MPPKQRVKSQAVTISVPQSREETDAAIARIGTLQLQRTRIHADKDERLAAIDREFKVLIEPLDEEIRTRAAGVQAWCEANRDRLTRDRKVKYGDFPAGQVKWRMRPPKVSLRAVEMLITILLERGLGRFIRTKQEVNKEAILAEPEAVAGVPGIKIEQGEDFVIEPFETKLEEVI
ncbi:MAG: host-nuclease inhibitor Gam family protein [Magnetococcales bacterium]|nr:host-nuclease inhibitor Gam family protein [Magnetococcales bacterium]MBF0215207.1 host-nuclease inhibitor Gam family protein [Magnetococcales bacterium]